MAWFLQCYRRGKNNRWDKTMENTIYIGLSRELALEQQMNLMANNIANMNTPGYKAGHILFAEYLDKPKGMKETVAMSYDYGNFRDQDNGPIKLTGNQLDVALEGPGYIGVSTTSGIQYSRAGNLKINSERQLVTAENYPIVDQGGKPIAIPEGTDQITIDQTGAIAGADGVIATMMVKEFNKPNELIPVGNTLYKTSEAGTQATKTRVIQGSIEGSNVQSVLEMTNMMEVSRDYQQIQRLLQSEHDRIRSVVKSLSETA